MDSSIQRECKAGIERINGFTYGFNFQQIFSYILYLSSLIIFITCIFPYLVTSSQYKSGILYYLSLLIMAILALICTYSDPTDPVIRNQKQARLNNVEKSMSELEYQCGICDAKVQEKSKHCRKCNRCVNEFDHHCQWLNNCVGKSNYRMFVMLIASVFINSLIYVIFSIIILTDAYSDSNVDSQLFTNVSQSTFIVMKVFVYLDMIIIGIIGILDFNLLLFHIYLFNEKLSTYEYIIKSKQAKQKGIPFGICNRSNSAKQKVSNDNSDPSQPKIQPIKGCCFPKNNQVASLPSSNNEIEVEKRSVVQEMMEGLMEKSVCNSLDVQEEDIRTQICNNNKLECNLNNNLNNIAPISSKEYEGTHLNQFGLPLENNHYSSSKKQKTNNLVQIEERLVGIQIPSNPYNKQSNKSNIEDTIQKISKQREEQNLESNVKLYQMSEQPKHYYQKQNSLKKNKKGDEDSKMQATLDLSNQENFLNQINTNQYYPQTTSLSPKPSQQKQQPHLLSKDNNNNYTSNFISDNVKEQDITDDKQQYVLSEDNRNMSITPTRNNRQNKSIEQEENEEEVQLQKQFPSDNQRIVFLNSILTQKQNRNNTLLGSNQRSLDHETANTLIGKQDSKINMNNMNDKKSSPTRIITPTNLASLTSKRINSFSPNINQ